MGKGSKRGGLRKGRLSIEDSKEAPVVVTYVRSPVAHIFLIVFIGLLVYSNTFHVPFVFDDESGIYKNITIRNTGYLTKASLPEILSAPRTIGQLTFTLNYALNGFDVTGYHIVNLLIHVSCALLVYWFVVLIFKTPYFADCFQGSGVRDQGSGIRIQDFAALFAALLFVSHPIQTQAVTYVVQRFASLATFFYLLSFVMYVKSRFSESLQSRYTLYTISVITAILAMKTKEISITLPVMVILCEFLFFRGEIKNRIIYLIPLSLTIVIIPLSLVMGGHGGPSSEIGGLMDEMTKGASLSSISPLDYLNTQFRVIVTYIRLLFFPVDQNLDYDYPIYETFFAVPVFSSFLLLLVIFGWGVYLVYRSSNSDKKERCFLRLMSFGIIWFFVTLSVESSIIPIADVINEHRLYLPSVGFFMVIMGGVVWVSRRLENRLLMDRAMMGVLVVLVISLSVAAHARNMVWQDEVKLWEDVVKKSPAKARAHYNRYESLGRAYLRQNRFTDALGEFQSALKIKGDFADPHKNLGCAYLKLRDFDKALEEFQSALKYEPSSFEIHNNLGNVYLNMARNEEAIRAFQTALELIPNDADARNNLENLHRLIKGTEKR